MKITIAESEGLGFNPFSAFIKVEPTDCIEDLCRGGIHFYDEIQMGSIEDIIFYGDIINPILDWIVPRLIADKYLVTIFSRIPITAFSNRVISFIELKELRYNIEMFRYYRERDVIILDAMSINEIKIASNILRNEKIRCMLCYNGDRIPSAQIMEERLYTEVPFYPSRISVEV